MKVIILLGAPGAGKGTTAECVRRDTRYQHISTGDMLREEVKNGSDVGREAEGYMKKGALVPDETIIRIVEKRLDSGKSDDMYMFDGFPRTVRQAELLGQSLAARKGAVNHVLYLDAPREVLIQRLTGRRICRKCGKNYHATNLPPKKAGICDLCGGELYQRADDTEATIVNRLDVFTKQTESLISYYEKQGVLVRVDSAQQADALVRDVMKVLAADGR